MVYLSGPLHDFLQYNSLNVESDDVYTTRSPLLQILNEYAHLPFILKMPDEIKTPISFYTKRFFEGVILRRTACLTVGGDILNDQAHLPGPLQKTEVAQNRYGGAVQAQRLVRRNAYSTCSEGKSSSDNPTSFVIALRMPALRSVKKDEYRR